MQQQELIKKVNELWGSEIKPINLPPSKDLRLKNNIDFNELTNENIIYLLDLLLKSSASTGGGFSVDEDNYEIFKVVKNKLYEVKSISRKLNPILRCYDLFFCGNAGEREGLWSLVVMYLIAELERYFRLNNTFTNSEGFILRDLPSDIDLNVGRFGIGTRVNQIRDIIKIFLHNNNTPFAIYLKKFDESMTNYVVSLITKEDLHSTIDGVKIPAEYQHWSLIDRVNKTRHAVMHGEKSAENEIFFFLTLHAILFLNDEEMYNE